MTKLTLPERFWSKVDKSGECWTWSGSTMRRGYGRIQIGGRVQLAHRVSYELTIGPIPNGMVIDHVCHQPACVKPQHLRVCSQKQNLENHSGAYSNSKSGVRGVRWHAKNRQWLVEVGHNGRRHYGGYFNTLEAAKVAAIETRNKLFTHNAADRGAE